MLLPNQQVCQVKERQGRRQAAGTRPADAVAFTPLQTVPHTSNQGPGRGCRTITEQPNTTSITNLPAKPSTPPTTTCTEPERSRKQRNHSGFGTAAPHAAVSGASLRGGANGFTACTPHHLCPSQNSGSTPLWSPACLIDEERHTC